MKNKEDLNKKEIIHLAKLCALTLTETEIEKFSKQLTQTIDYVKNLNELNTVDIDPTYQTTKLSNIFFDDEIEENKRSLSLTEIFINNKKKKNNCFLVNKIL